MMSARIMPRKNVVARSAGLGAQRALLHAALHLGLDAIVDLRMASVFLAQACG